MNTKEEEGHELLTLKNISSDVQVARYNHALKFLD